MAGLTLAAPAKLNLGLGVVDRRPDGFHEIDSVMVRLDLADRLRLETIPEPDVVGEALPGADPQVAAAAPPVDASNLAVVAARRYLDAAGWPGGVRVALAKEIPVAAGLGGGSSDAGAVLRGLSELYPAGVDLLALAAEIGSDVPFFVGPFVAARVGGRGERLTAAAAPHCGALLVNPGVPVSAADAYRWLERPGGALPLAGWSATGCAVVQDALRNDLQPGVAVRTPEVPAALTALARLELGPVAMSGSGATCYALSGDLEALAAGAEALAAERPRWWIRTVAFAADRLSR